MSVRQFYVQVKLEMNLQGQWEELRAESSLGSTGVVRLCRPCWI